MIRWGIPIKGSAELSATQVKKLEELEERIDKLTDIYEEATNTLHASCSSEQQTQGSEQTQGLDSATQVKKLEELEERIDEQPDKQSYKPRPFEDPRGYQGKEVGCLEQDAGWLEQHYKAMRAPGLLGYKDVRYIKLQ